MLVSNQVQEIGHDMMKNFINLNHVASFLDGKLSVWTTFFLALIIQSLLSNQSVS